MSPLRGAGARIHLIHVTEGSQGEKTAVHDFFNALPVALVREEVTQQKMIFSYNAS